MLINRSTSSCDAGKAEELGFDVLWNCDAINDPDFPRVPFFEATSILTAMAMHTSTIRVGTLMNSLIFRNPAVVAKAAMTIDHISGGRLELFSRLERALSTP